MPFAKSKIFSKDRNSEKQGLFRALLTNGSMYVEIGTIGASIMGIYIPGSTGFVNIVLHYQGLEDYLSDPYYLGSTVGRVAGRINKGRLPINNKLFQLSLNENAKHHLHGGYKAFSKKIFDIVSLDDTPSQSIIKLRSYSPSGDDGYPGNVQLLVTYTLHECNTLTIEYEAVTDQATHINITNHSYFNLRGYGSGLDQHLQIHAQQILQTDEEFIPTGHLVPILNTRHNFTTMNNIREQKKHLPGKFFNECYVFDNGNFPAAVLFDPESHRMMELNTSYPCLIFYSGDYLDDPFHVSGGVCLEPQFFPDGPNLKPNGETLLLPGERYQQNIQLTFSW